jgi:hypothetical protein
MHNRNRGETHAFPAGSTGPLERNHAQRFRPPRRNARINGARSRGPITLAGKLNSRRNALKHGLHATVLNSDEPAFATKEGFIQILLGLVNDLMPQSCVERHLIMDLAMAKWRLGIVCGQETEILDRCADVIRGK